jgi:thiol-disulfide isomerase/thioredoxin
MKRVFLLHCWLIAGVFIVSTARAETKPAAIGSKIPDIGGLRDLRGNGRTLHGFKDHKAVVIVFLGTECPISNLYVPTLLQLEKKYRDQKIQFLASYSNETEDLDQIGIHSYDRDLPFPVLKDAGQKLADAVGITRVPSVAVLDGEFNLRYRGRIDDRYGVSYRKQKATRADLGEAIDEVLAGKKVTVVEAEADGCLLDRGGKKLGKTGVTYAKDISRIIQNRCQNCHRPGQTAPFALMTYDDAVKHARTMKEVTQQKRMPPWHVDPRFGHFANDRRMSKDEIETLAAWVDGGMAKGDDKDLPKVIDWPEGWTHGKPDLVISMPEEFEVPADGSLPYKQYTIDPKFTEDKWVRIAEGLPGSPSVVHHLVVYILKPGQQQPFSPDGNIQILVGWAPGDLGTVCPPESALRIPKGSTLRFEMHYTPNGTKTKDRSKVGITFADKPPKFEYFTNSFMNESIEVPPFDPHYKAEATWRLRGDARILSFVPHMHWRGKDYRYEVIYPDGKRETILNVPRWDFNWQNVYQLKEPLKLPKGARLHAVAHWDNSVNNPYNPAPDKMVKFGLQTWDEMMVGWVAYVWERPETVTEMAKIKFDDPDSLFDRLDRNGDDVVTPDEIPDQLKPFIKAYSLKVPERMTREEFTKMFVEMRGKLTRPQPGKKPDEKKP